MTTMILELYEALISAGATEEKAKEAPDKKARNLPRVTGLVNRARALIMCAGS